MKQSAILSLAEIHCPPLARLLCVFAFAAYVMIGMGAIQAAERKRELSVEQKALLDAFFRLEMGTATSRDGSALSKLARTEKYGYYAIPWLAQYRREKESDPLGSLEAVAPLLYMEQAHGKELLAAIRDYRKEAKEKSTAARLRLPAGARPNVNYDWSCIEGGRALMALGQYAEATRMLDAVGRSREDFPRVMAAEAAGDVFAMQRKWNEAERWYASALKFYRIWCNTPAPPITEEERDLLRQAGPSIWGAIEDAVVSRIKLKLDEAKRMIEMEYYGPGYYLYKEAEVARRKSKDYRYAVAIYDEIIDSFEKTVYGDAAKCYRILCLLQLAQIDRDALREVEEKRIDSLMESDLEAYEKTRAQSEKDKGKEEDGPKYTKDDLRKRMQEIEHQKERIPWWPKRGDASDMARELVKLVRGDGSEGEAEDMHVDAPAANDKQAATHEADEAAPPVADKEKTVEGADGDEKTLAAVPESYAYDLYNETRDERFLRRCKMASNVPIGEKAEKEAFAALDRLLNEQYYGLYRGEAMVAAGTYMLEEKFDLAAATDWFRKATEWCEGVEEFDREIATFVLSQNVRAVSGPPPSMKKKDVWGNVHWQSVKPGDIHNRRSSGWYLDYQHMIAQTKWAFCLFVDGKAEQAIPMLGIILENDPTELALHKRGWPNSYARLKAEFEQGRLFATKEDLAHFKGRAKLAIMVADYYYEIEQWHEAARRYREFKEKFGGELDETARAYVTLMLAYTANTTGDKKTGTELFQTFETEYRETPSWPRAMFTLFTIYQSSPDTRNRALWCLDQIQKELPNDEMGKKAHLYKGIFHYSFGNYDLAERIFNECEKAYVGTWLAKGATNYLILVEEKRAEAQKQEKEDA